MGTDLSYEYGGTTYTGYLADGSGGKAAPGVLVLHEGSGLGPHAKQKADLLATQGYVAFAPDLFGEKIEDMATAGKHIGQLSADWAELRARATAGLNVLKAQPHVDASKLAAIGFCFGGGAAIELGRSGADLKAIVGFHSGLKSPRYEDTGNIKAKVLVALGDADLLVNREARDAFMDNMTASKVDAQMLLLSGVGHSFTNVDAEAFGVPSCHYNAVAEKRSWAAMTALFDEAFAA